MLNLFDTFAKKRVRLIVEEKDVMTMLKMFDDVKRNTKFSYSMDMKISNCGWIEEPDKWYIFFTATNKNWNSIIAELKKEGRKIVLGEDDLVYLT